MKIMMYSVYDNVAEIFNKPFTDHNDGSARRAFMQSMKEVPETHKNDYSIYRVAEFNDATGEITPVLPDKIMTGFDIKSEE